MKHGTQLLVDKLTDEQYEEFQERCAIMEHEGQLTKDDAEYRAVMDVLGIVKVKAT